MPLSRIRSDILRLLASHRDPESYLPGSTPLTRSTPRYSGDIDIFHDREERVARAAQNDSAFLEEHGYTLQWLRRDPLIYTVLTERAGEAAREATRTNGLPIAISGFSQSFQTRPSVTSCIRLTWPPIKCRPLMAAGNHAISSTC